MKRKLKVAIIDNSINPALYDPVAHWNTYLKAAGDAFRAPQSRFPSLKTGYTHLVLTGSEASILQREKWVDEEIELVQNAAHKELSILGSCYGHQLLALALAGPSHVQRCPQPEVGWIPIKISKENFLLGKKRTAYSFSVHFDEVINLADPFVILASSRHCSIQVFGLKGKNIWGLQIHPEINIPQGQELLRTFLQIDPRIQSHFINALNSRPRDSGLIHLIADNFLTFFP